MADVNFTPPDQSGCRDDPRAADQVRLFEVAELLFFAYRDFISDPDVILAEFDFGRAHHRVIHFISRNPGIRVADLLDILRITKQSLGRVLKQLIKNGFVFQKEGLKDRRQRLLYLTDEGSALAARLAAPQFTRIESALDGISPEGRAAFLEVLYKLINAKDRNMVNRTVFGHKPRPGKS